MTAIIRIRKESRSKGQSCPLRFRLRTDQSRRNAECEGRSAERLGGVQLLDGDWGFDGFDGGGEL